MPILGVLDSAKTGNLSVSAYESIATVTVSSSQQVVSFTSIPQTFTHLQVRGIYRAPSAATYMNITTSAGQNFGTRNYSLLGNAGNNPTTNASIGTNGKGQELDVYVSGLVANMFAPVIVDIWDYTNTNKFKTVKGFSGYPDGSSFQEFGQLFSVTNAITGIEFYANGSYPQYTTFALYGIKGA
jgi:hypothetical protein